MGLWVPLVPSAKSNVWSLTRQVAQQRYSMGAAVRLEWRGEDHPAAGILLAPGDRQRVLVYLHLAVKGTTIRKAIPHVRIFSLSVQELARVTADGLDEVRSNRWQ